MSTAGFVAHPSGRATRAGTPPRRTHAERTAMIGMAIFIASWTMLFAALFFSYGALRLGAHVWPPEGAPHLPLVLPTAATLLLAMASASLHSAVKGAPGVASRKTIVAALLGIGFLALQASVWRQMVLAGLRPDGGAYASFFFTLTVFHALHVLVGLAGLAVALARWRARGPLALRLWTLYWHMVGVLWVIIYVLVYVTS